MSAITSKPVQDLTGMRLVALPPLSLYVHIPWCIRKCPYCDFNSHEIRTVQTIDTVSPDEDLLKSPIPLARPGAAQAQTRAARRGYFNSHQAQGAFPEQEYVEALISDLDQALPKIWGRRVYSIFFGGGTPSLFSAKSIEAMLSAIRARVSLSTEAEITLEANPGTFESEKFRDFRSAGVNRLSIGIQSFNAQHLEALGRVHNAAEARRAIDIGMTHFDNVNLDLMYALPQQTLAQCEADVEAALEYSASHLSIYHLTLEPNTLFYRFPPPLPDDDLAADMQAMIDSRLMHAGYEHYETSAYCQTSRASRHNLNYWRFGDYLGVGAGAHSKISFADRITREMRFKQPRAYMEAALRGAAVQEEKTLSRSELPFEFMMNALRLSEGFPVPMFAERTGLSLSAVEAQLSRAEERGLLERDHLTIRPSELGRRFLNDLLQIFLPA
jgi:putative oxygen-independent coproporphyrinogen III oxidase